MIFTFWSVTNTVLSPTLLAQVQYTDKSGPRVKKSYLLKKGKVLKLLHL